MFLKQIANADLAQYAYLIGCQKSGEALLIDPLQDIQQYLEIANADGLKITAVAETHIHADFISGAQAFSKYDPGILLYLSDEGGDFWRSEWALGLSAYRPMKEGSIIKIGNLSLNVIHTPGHTPEHVAFLLTDMGGGADEPMALFSGDFLFVGDVGRPDLLEQAAGFSGSQQEGAHDLFHSLQKLSRLPEYIQVLPGHGAGSSCGKALGAVPSSTLGYEVRFNEALKFALQGDKDSFVSYILDGQPEPPSYFARMKKINREGSGNQMVRNDVSLLSINEVERGIVEQGWVIVDTRPLEAFIPSHIRGSQFVSREYFSDFAGSFLEPEAKLVLVAEDNLRAREVLVSLKRLGIDHVMGFVHPDSFDDFSESLKHSIPSMQASDLEESALDEKRLILDVRKATERKGFKYQSSLHLPHARTIPDLREVPLVPLVTHCQSGLRAAGVASFLLRKGWQDVRCALGPPLSLRKVVPV